MNLGAQLRYDFAGLVPAVLQDSRSLEVLIVAFMNHEAVERTLATGVVHLWSRSRQQLWLKGESSGRFLRIKEVRPNCELNSLLILVEQALPGACHTGHSSCYYRRIEAGELCEVSPQVFDPGKVYAGADKSSLESLLSAYGWLYGQPVIPQSGTSRSLHGLGPEPSERLTQEWEELLGVLRGTHVHEGFEQDVDLEAYQVLYWTCLYHVVSMKGTATGLAYPSVMGGYDGDRDPGAVLNHVSSAQNTVDRLDVYWSALGAACRVGGIEPERVVKRDLRDLRSRNYMTPYFDSQGDG